jgi:hypothetical protein
MLIPVANKMPHIRASKVTGSFAREDVEGASDKGFALFSAVVVGAVALLGFRMQQVLPNAARN